MDLSNKYCFIFVKMINFLHIYTNFKRIMLQNRVDKEDAKGICSNFFSDMVVIIIKFIYV